jgi:hypothetical protein
MVFLLSTSMLDAIRWALRPQREARADSRPTPHMSKPFGSLISLEQFRVSIQFL